MHLTPTELHLLEILMLNAERVVPRTEVFETVWCPPLDPTSNVVDVHMAHLRRKLREGGAGPAIHTVRGVGYVLRT
jgi:DNA-binding response OmpR family regulator